MFLYKFRKSIGLNNDTVSDFYDIKIKHSIDENNIEKLQKEYCCAFKTRAKDIDFKKDSCINKHMMLMHKNLFGENIITTEILGKYKIGNTKNIVFIRVSLKINIKFFEFKENLISFC